MDGAVAIVCGAGASAAVVHHLCRCVCARLCDIPSPRPPPPTFSPTTQVCRPGERGHSGQCAAVCTEHRCARAGGGGGQKAGLFRAAPPAANWLPPRRDASSLLPCCPAALPHHHPTHCPSLPQVPSASPAWRRRWSSTAACWRTGRARRTSACRRWSSTWRRRRASWSISARRWARVGWLAPASSRWVVVARPRLCHPCPAALANRPRATASRHHSPSPCPRAAGRAAGVVPHPASGPAGHAAVALLRPQRARPAG